MNMNPTIIVALIGAGTTIFGSVISYLFSKSKYKDDITSEGLFLCLQSIQVILDSLHREGKVNGQCEECRKRMNEFESKIVSKSFKGH